jgi:hypothetical protein
MHLDDRLLKVLMIGRDLIVVHAADRRDGFVFKSMEGGLQRRWHRMLERSRVHSCR